jgi:hypothetical protein
LRELQPSARKMPPESLAGLLQSKFREALQEPERFGQDIPSREMASLRDKVITDYVGQRFRERFEADTLRLPKPGQASGELSLQVWRGLDEQRIVLHSRLISPGAQTRILRETMRKDLLRAWSVRLALGRRKLDLVMLLGSNTGGWPGIEASHPRLWEIHQYETAGWKVFPWDFAAAVPAFIKFMEGAPYEESEPRRG